MNSPTRVVILNGPPNSGKDVLASYCRDQAHSGYESKTAVRRFKESLYTVTAMMYCVDLDWLIKVCNDREEKELHQVELGCSPREALIYTSERMVKPCFGNEWFGCKAAQSLAENNLHYFSDGGFADEMYPLLRKVGCSNFLLVRLRREGCTFEGDSRNYLDSDLCPNYYELTNSGELWSVGNQLVRRVNEWIRETSEN